MLGPTCSGIDGLEIAGSVFCILFHHGPHVALAYWHAEQIGIGHFINQDSNIPILAITCNFAMECDQIHDGLKVL